MLHYISFNHNKHPCSHLCIITYHIYDNLHSNRLMIVVSNSDFLNNIIHYYKLLFMILMMVFMYSYTLNTILTLVYPTHTNIIDLLMQICSYLYLLIKQ